MDMKRLTAAAAALFAALICLFTAGCGNPVEGKINDYIKNNAEFSSMIETLKTKYSEAMELNVYGKEEDLVIEMNINAELPEESLSGLSDFSGLTESVTPYLQTLRSETGNGTTNVIYIVKDKSGREIVNKTIS